MSARELHRYIRNPGKRKLGFNDIQPFVDSNRFSLIGPAYLALGDMVRRIREGTGLSREKILLLDRLEENGVLIHPLSFDVCLRLDSNPLSVDGVPFHVYFHHLVRGRGIGGTFIDNDEKSRSSVFLSLSCAIHLLSAYLVSNNLHSLKVKRIGREYLVQRHNAGNLHEVSQEQLMTLFHDLVGTRLFEKEINRLFTNKSVEEYVGLVECFLRGIALHEAAHVLHKRAGILGLGGLEKEEERAYLSEIAYGNSGLVFAYLPTSGKDDPNNRAARGILEKLFRRCDLGHLLDLTRVQLSELAKELLDEDFRHNFGAHHDQIVPAIEIQRVRKHLFFGNEHLPMFESLRYLPKKKKAA
jgi:hypothetical protein